MTYRTTTPPPPLSRHAGNTWQKVTRTEPCEACGKPDWCARSAEDEAVRCMRPEISMTPAGYYVQTPRDREGAIIYVPNTARDNGIRRNHPYHRGRRKTVTTSSADHARPDFAALHQQYRAAVEPGLIADLADTELGLDGVSVDRLEPGWSDREQCMIFPERDAEGRIIGLERQYLGRRKRAIKGGRRGLTYAMPLSEADPVLIVEGASDTAAAMQAGFTVVGRPSYKSGGAMLAQLLTGRDVIVVGENDRKDDRRWPGREGAQHIAKQLIGACQRVRTVFPPDGVKDIRSWLLLEGVR